MKIVNIQEEIISIIYKKRLFRFYYNAHYKKYIEIPEQVLKYTITTNSFIEYVQKILKYEE